jgi:hypothetical protein
MQIERHSLEEALLFLVQSRRAGVAGDPRSADWAALAMHIIAEHVDARDTAKGTPDGLVMQLLEPIGGRRPGISYLKPEDIRNGWLCYEHADGRKAICREGEASFAEAIPKWYRVGTLQLGLIDELSNSGGKQP